MSVEITLAYGRKLEATEAQMDEWLNDLLDEHEELMHQPLHVAHPFAFCAPEIIRGAVTQHIIKTNLQE